MFCKNAILRVDVISKTLKHFNKLKLQHCEKNASSFCSGKANLQIDWLNVNLTKRDLVLLISQHYKAKGVLPSFLPNR